jgi:YVTN family beta-propeller protein
MPRLFLFTLFAVPAILALYRPAPAPTARPTLLIANQGSRTLTLIDPSSGQQIASVAESGITGHEVAASPDGKRAFVPIYGDSGVGSPGTDGRTIDVIDIASHRVIQTFDFGHGVRPHCVMFGPKDGLLYVTTELDQAVTIIDPSTLKIVGTIPTGQPESHMLAISPDGTRGYTANVGPGSVSVLDMVGRKTLSVIPVATHIQRISVSTDGRWVFTSDTEKPRLAVISSASGKIDRWIELPGMGYGSASTPDGSTLLIAIPGKDSVAAIDLKTMQITKTVAVAAHPQEVIIRPDGRVAYVSCGRAGQVAAISLSDWSVQLMNASTGADGLAWAN